MARYSAFEKERRTASRIALYTILAASAGLLALFLALAEPSLRRASDTAWASADRSRHPEIGHLQEYLRIDTSPQGSELEGARYLAELLREAGVDATILDMGGGKANLWARLEGESPETLVLHNHLDVEPVPDPTLWEHEPFGAEIDGPWIYGRGAFDMKSVAIAQLEAFLAVAESGRKPARSLLFLGTSSEERGSDEGTRWLLENRPELFEDTWAVLTEGGAIEVLGESRIKYWGIEFGQKRYVPAVACSDSRQRLEQLRRDILERGSTGTTPRLTPVVAEFLDRYAPTRTADHVRDLMMDTQDVIDDPVRFGKVPAPVRAMLRDEVHGFAAKAVDDGPYEMRILVHLLPGSDLDTVVAELMPPWMTHGITVQWRRDEPPAGHSPLDHPVFEGLTDGVRDHYPGVEVGPLYLSWYATDARFFREKDLVAYGFSPFVVPTPEVLRIAGGETVEERIGVEGFVEGVELYRDLVRRLVAADND